MYIIIGTPTTTAGTAYTLIDNDEFWSFAGDTIVSSGSNAIFATGSDNTLTIGGHIYGYVDPLAIGNSATDIGNTINIQTGGVVGGLSDDAISITASHTTVNNAGTIMASDDGIVIEASSGPGTTVINNTSLIRVTYWCINNNGSEDLVFTNTGAAVSLGHESYDGGVAVDKVINKGLMVGSVKLDTGDDTYDGRSGRVTANASGATIYGSVGKDTLLGGKFVDTFDGGDNNDTLQGGLAKDLLTGGLGQDKFVFNALAECGDTITDFATVDDTIAVKSSAFGGIAKGVLSAAAYFSNTTGLAHDASDRFIYETDTDKLWYDSNGNAAGGTHILVADLNDVNFTRMDLLVF